MSFRLYVALYTNVLAARLCVEAKLGANRLEVGVREALIPPFLSNTAKPFVLAKIPGPYLGLGDLAMLACEKLSFDSLLETTRVPLNLIY